MAALARKFNRSAATEDERSSSKKPAFSRLWGVAASLVAHIVLLMLLAIITLQLPSQAGLALKASPSTVPEQVLELNQPIEVNLPDATAETPTVPVAEITEVLRPLETMQFDTSGALASSAEHLSSAAAAAAGAAMAASGPLQNGASFFGSAVGGNCFCYIMDASGSMRGGPWEAAKSELLKSLAGLKATQRFYIIFFNRELSAIPNPGQQAPAPRTLYASSENLAHAGRWIDTVQIGTGGPPNDALQLAIEMEPDAIYLLTDGVTSVDVAGFLREKNRVEDLLGESQIRVPIHTIAYYSLDGRELLQRIASENLGRFLYVPDPRRR